MRSGSRTTLGLILKVILLGAVLGIAVLGATPLIQQQKWIGLALLLAATGLLFWIYLSPRRIPAKYLVPGTLFLLVFQVFPVLYTVSTAFTNYGDGHRSGKAEAIRAIESGSVHPVRGSAQYRLSIGVEAGRDPATAGIALLLTDDKTRRSYVGTRDGLADLSASDVKLDPKGKVLEAKGFTVLKLHQVNRRSQEVGDFRVPTEKGAIKSQGLSSAFEGAAQLVYAESCDCIRDAVTGKTWKAENRDGYFRGEDGVYLAQGWQVNVGLRNFADVVTNPVISRYFFGILAWNLAYATLSVGLSFALGLLVAIVLNHERLRGRRIYRSLLILPYAMPSFAMLLVWRDMFNPDFGLINRLFGLHVNWFGTPWGARFAVVLVQIWLTYPYMFLISTGALQAIPPDLTEAASVDGAKPFYAFRTVTFPLLMVALAPPLIASFAFNFNNFNAVYFTSEGAPFPPDNPRVGATDLLITYTFRIAFGGQGAQYGLASTISIFIFLIVALVSLVGFRRARVLEEIH